MVTALANRFSVRGRRAFTLKLAALAGRIRLFGEDRKAKWCWVCGIDVSWRAGSYGRLFRAEPYAGDTGRSVSGHLCPECCIEVRRRVDAGGWLWTDEQGRKWS